MCLVICTLQLTHYDLVTPHGDIDLGQHALAQVMTSPGPMVNYHRCCGIHLRANAQVLKLLSCLMNLNLIKILPHPCGQWVNILCNTSVINTYKHSLDVIMTRCPDISEHVFHYRNSIVTNLFSLMGNAYLEMDMYKEALIYHQKDYNCVVKW